MIKNKILESEPDVTETSNCHIKFIKSLIDLAKKRVLMLQNTLIIEYMAFIAKMPSVAQFKQCRLVFIMSLYRGSCVYWW